MNTNALLVAALALLAKAKHAFDFAPDEEKQIQAFGKLVQFSTIASDERGREGYADVVAMMHSTANTIGVLCQRVNYLVGQLPAPTTSPATTQAIHSELTTLGNLITQLGEIAPADVWIKPAK